MIADDDLREELRRINSNSRLSEFYLSLARDLDVMEPKTPDEVGRLYLRISMMTPTLADAFLFLSLTVMVVD